MTAINPRSNRRIFGEEDDSIEPMGRATLKRRSQNILSDAAKAVDEEEFMSPLLKRELRKRQEAENNFRAPPPMTFDRPAAAAMPPPAITNYMSGPANNHATDFSPPQYGGLGGGYGGGGGNTYGVGGGGNYGMQGGCYGQGGGAGNYGGGGGYGGGGNVNTKIIISKEHWKLTDDMMHQSWGSVLRTLNTQPNGR